MQCRAAQDHFRVRHPDWEQDLGLIPLSERRRKYSYTRYDDHGNWTNATIAVTEGKEQYTITVVRTFSYYD